jgi:hypothetical protein
MFYGLLHTDIYRLLHNVQNIVMIITQKFYMKKQHRITYTIINFNIYKDL